MSGSLFVISAPSGAGKTTLLKRLLAGVSGICFSVSHTTRKPRKGEREGIDYHFVDRKRFLELKQQDLFLEWAEVHGNLYGTSRAMVEERLGRGQDLILDIDVQGARKVREKFRNRAVFIFIAPPSLEVLKNRLRSRGTDDEETISLRIANAQKELAASDEYDFLVVNDRLEEAETMLRAIVLAERSRTRRDIHGKPLRLPAGAGSPHGPENPKA